MKYAIIASAFSGNKGAAAMLHSSVERLSGLDPEARFVLLSVYPRTDANLNPYPNLGVLDASPLRLGVVINGTALLHRLIPPARKALESRVPEVAAIAGADVLLDEGGITFVDGRDKFLIYNVATVLPALFMKTPVVKIAQALGPFESALNKVAARAVLPRMATIYARGAVTLQHLRDFRLTNVRESADLAFTLPVHDADREAAAEIAGDFFAEGGVVGFSPSVVLAKGHEEGEEAYVAGVVEQIDYVTTTLGRRVLLVAHSARAHTDKTHNNDLPLAREIYARLDAPDKVLFDDAEVAPGVLRALIGQCDVFVASRFHAMVSALSEEVPTLVIGWSHKYREVLDMFGLAEWAVPQKDATLGWFRDALSTLIEQRNEVQSAIAAKLPVVVETSLEQVEGTYQTARRGK